MSTDFEIGALERYLSDHVAGFRGPLRAERIDGGQSNPTYHLHTPSERYVLRKKPPGVLLPSAHAVEREHRVLMALAGTPVPVPRTLCLCEDTSVVGTPFYVMAYVAGRTFWDPALPGCSRAEREAMYRDLNRVLAAIHEIDLERHALTDYGKPGNFFERQVSRWSKQYRAAETETIASMDWLIEWLGAHVPATSQVRLSHGDYRMDNLLFHPTEPRIVAVLDWELSTLGDPLGDLAHHLMSWLLSPGEFRGMAGRDLAELGIPDEPSYVAAYCARRDIEPPSTTLWTFAVACAMFRLASILQGIKKRADQGNASASNAEAVGRGARIVADAALRYVQCHAP